MTDTEKVYTSFIEENLGDIEEIQKDVECWKKIYKKRVFDTTWPESIQDTIRILRLEIKKEIDQCLYYIKRIREVRDEQSSQAQPKQNPENALSKRANAGDTDKDLAVVESEDLGVAPQKIDDSRGENQ